MPEGHAADGFSGRVIGAVMRERSVFGPGFTETVYQNALALEMALEDTPFERDVQGVDDLAATGLEQALRLNFGTRSLQIKKKSRTPRHP